jgi:uncharacterized protein (DUF1697 family)
MTCYIALVRGINVGGKMIKMEPLRASFEALGFDKVRTYIQSGNVLFESRAGSPTAIIRRIEEKILADFKHTVRVFLKTDKEMADVVKRNPFVKDKTVDPARLHVTFLAEDAPASAAACLETLAATAERYHISGREIFLYCPNGYGNSKLANPFIERKLRLAATTRNWKTVNTLLAMSQETE